MPENEIVDNYYSMLGLYWGSGKENGNYYSILGLSGGNRKENGNQHTSNH